VNRIEELSDHQLLKQLEQAENADLILHSEQWALVHEAMRRVVEQTKDLLAKHDPSDTLGIIRLQERIALFDQGFLPALLNNLRAVGEFTFEELKERKAYRALYERIAARL